MEGDDYLQIIADWDAVNRSRKKDDKDEKPDKADNGKQQKKPEPPSYAEATTPYRDPLTSKEPPHAFLRRAELAQRAVGASVFEHRPCFKAMCPKRAEGERADQTRRFEENSGPARRRRNRAFPLCCFERGIELPHPDDADKSP